MPSLVRVAARRPRRILPNMALYNMITFNLLCFQMVLFFGLIVPLPFNVRRKMLHFISSSPVVAKLLYGLKIMFIFVGVLFVDALQHMIKVQREGQAAKESGLRGDVRSETDWRSRKFLSERNMYLTGFTLFLSLILTRTYNLIMDLLQAQEELMVLKKQGGAGERSDKHLEEKLEALQKEYDALAAKSGQPVSIKKTD